MSLPREEFLYLKTQTESNNEQKSSNLFKLYFEWPQIKKKKTPTKRTCRKNVPRSKAIQCLSLQIMNLEWQAT